MTYRHLVLFTLENEEYGVEISYVQEIIRIPQITKVPDMPSYVEGIINLRGKIIPVIDLKSKFGFGQSGRCEDSRLLVLTVEGITVSIIVDDVSEVLRLDEKCVETLPAKISRENGNCLSQIGKIDERLLLLLDVKKALINSSLF